MLTIFEKILLGHLVGDYLLQNTWMSLRKGSQLFPLVIHCLLYSVSVCLFTTFNIWWFIVVFLSHFPVDKFSLADKWLKLINGRSLEVFFKTGHENISKDNRNEQMNYRILRGGFTSLVYTIVDNTIHLLLMLLGYYMLNKYGVL